MNRFAFLRSFRLRVFLILLILGVAVAEIMRVSMLADLVDRRVEQRSAELSAQIRILSDHMLAADYLRDNSSEALNAQLSQLSLVYDGRIQLVDRGFRIIADSYGQNLGKYMIREDVIRAFSGVTVKTGEREDGYIELACPVSQRDEESGELVTEAVILARASTETILRNEAELRYRALLIEIVLLIFLAGVCALIAYTSVRPFERVTRAMADVVDFEQDLPVVSDYKETREIVEAFHKLRSRLKLLDESRQEFVSNVSHELKTPIASIKVLADSLNTQTDVPVEMYRDFMQDISAEVDRENEIITDLLDLVRMDQGTASMHVENQDVNELLEQIIKRLGPLARKSEVDLILESRRPVSADMDVIKMSQALTNIIENGIKYNKRPGWVRIILDADHQAVSITISDSGNGIPEAELEHIFERFYRVDKSHSREIGGTGLGLSLSRRTLLLHRGSIDVKSTLGEGTSFTVKFPQVYISEGGEKR
ncbi:MAG: HAMP domain-containing histidine kinase [Lachnospiraceae bacterium]|nr:HAMP domain-containing histidine kinase [Lachnospiraceae bacterium]